MVKQLLLDKSLKKIEYTFRWTGMNLGSASRTPTENFKYKMLYIFNFLWLNTDVAGAVGWFFDGARKGASFTTLTYVAPCITMCFLANMKSIYFFIYDQQVCQLLENLRAMETNQNLKDEAKKDIIKQESAFLFFVLKVSNFFNWTLMVAFPLMPLSLTAIVYYNSGLIELNLPFHVLYPFDAYDVKYWPFVYLRQIWGTVIVIIEISGADYFYFIVITCVCIQFKLLQYDIRTLIKEDGIEDFGRLVELIKWHQELIKCVQLVEVIYSKSTLFNVVSSSLLICLSGFNVTTIDDVPFIVSFGCFLFMSLLQIFVMCYYGDMLMYSSTAVANAVYESKWYLTNPAFGKQLYIILMRAQKPCKLTAYGFADVNLGAFRKILSTSWSYFALLKTVYSSPRV